MYFFLWHSYFFLINLFLKFLKGSFCTKISSFVHVRARSCVVQLVHRVFCTNADPGWHSIFLKLIKVFILWGVRHLSTVSVPFLWIFPDFLCICWNFSETPSPTPSLNLSMSTPFSSNTSVSTRLHPTDDESTEPTVESILSCLTHVTSKWSWPKVKNESLKKPRPPSRRSARRSWLKKRQRWRCNPPNKLITL